MGSVGDHFTSWIRTSTRTNGKRRKLEKTSGYKVQIALENAIIRIYGIFQKGREKTMSAEQITALENELAIVQAKINNGSGDAAELAALVDQQNLLTNQIAEKKYELEQQAAKEAERKEQIEEKVQASGIPFAVSGVDFTELPAQVIKLMELVVKADRRRIYAEVAIDQEQAEQKHREELAAAEEQYDQISAELAQLEIAKALVEADNAGNKALADVLQSENNALKQEKLQLIAERDEARKNRDNAAAQLDEANKEIARLKSEVDDYQKAKVFGEREAQNIIETVPAEAEEINNAMNELKKFYTGFENFGAINKVYKADGSYELVKTADLQNEWIPAPAVGGSEGTDSFRSEDVQNSATNTGDSGVQGSEVVSALEPPTLQIGLELGGDTTVPQGDEQKPVSREEFEALAKRVAVIEAQQATGAAA